jgi:hypothetical protein
MLTYREVPDTNVVEIEIDGAISTAEFDDLLVRLEAAIARHGHIRVLEIVRSLGGVPASRWWQDVKFGARHFKHISHAGIVADARWLEILTNIANPFFSADVRYFNGADIEKARAWLRESETAPPPG